MKKFISGLLVVALVLSLSAVAVSAEEATKAIPSQTWSQLTIASDGKTATGYCPHCDTANVTWTLLTRAAAGHTNITASGHYFLNASTAANGALQTSTAGIDVVLHLNSQTVKRNGAGGNNTGTIRAQAANTTISIVDNQAQTGTIHGDYGWAISNGQSGTTVKLYSGNLTSVVETVATSGNNLNGGTVNITAGTFEMYGGTVNGTKATYGGALYFSGNTVANIYGGTINGGEAKLRGGAIYTGNANNKVNIYGGTIQNGKCLGEYAEGGGNIYSKGAVNIYGGVIDGGQSTNGGNVYVLNTTTINGTATLKNGKATYGGNLFVDNALTLGASSFENGKATYGQDIYVSATANMTVDAAYNGVATVYYALNHIPDKIYGDSCLAAYKNRADQSNVEINRCTGVFSGKLYLENDPGMPLIYAKNTSSKYLWIKTTRSAGLVDNNGNTTWYNTNDEALAAYDSNTAYLIAGDRTMHPDGGNYVVDLAGLDVTIVGSGSMTLFDSANADYKTYGTATVAGVTVNNNQQGKTTVAGNDYFMVKTADNKYTFHRVGVNIVGVSVRPSSTGIYYTGKWSCDALMAEQIDQFGVAVSVRKSPDEKFATTSGVKFTEISQDKFESGIETTGVIVKNILTAGNRQNGTYAGKKIYATAYMTFQDGSVVISNENYGFSLNDTMEILQERKVDYVDIVEDLQAFQDQWKDDGVSWNHDFSVSEDVVLLNEAYNGKTAYHGEAHDHAATGGNSDGNFTLNQWKKGMELENMDFTTIVDHRQNSHMTGSDWDATKFIGGTEASTELYGGAYDSLTDSKKMHYSIIFTDASDLDYVAKHSVVEKDYGFIKDYYSLYNYPNMNTAAVQGLIEKVKEYGGMFTIVHPKANGYLKTDDASLYWFADWTGLEVFYGAGGYAPTQDVNKENYKLWTDLLAMGKKVWATAGSDVHAAPNTNALTTIYSHSSSATDIFSYMKTGNSVCGPVGIRMIVGDTQMGSQTDFAGKRLSFSVGDFHESIYDPTHRYSVKLISDQGTVYETEFDASETFYYGMDADESAAFYRVEVYDLTAGYDLPIAIGNPIWNQ